MTLRLNGSTSGFTEIDAPAVAGSNTLVLPTGNGTSGQVLTTNGSGALSWVSQKVLQVVMGTTATMVSTSSTTFADTGLTATITPATSSSKILVLVTQNGCWKSSANAGNALNLRLVTPVVTSIFGGEVGYTGSALENLIGSCGFNYLDSPATTSACVYKTQFSQRVAAAAAQVQTNGAISSIILVELAS